MFISDCQRQCYAHESGETGGSRATALLLSTFFISYEWYLATAFVQRGEKKVDQLDEDDDSDDDDVVALMMLVMTMRKIL